MEKVRDRDVQHLQSEIRQLRNQQYLTSTAGVTITFVILALIIDPRFSGDDAARFGISIAFIVTITMLFVIGWRQRKLIAIISSYIRVIGGSYWEDDFRKFTTQYRYVSQTVSMTLIFVINAILVFATISWKIADHSSVYFISMVIVYAVVIVMFLGIGKYHWFLRTRAIEQKWTTIISSVADNRT